MTRYLILGLLICVMALPGCGRKGALQAPPGGHDVPDLPDNP